MKMYEKKSFPRTAWDLFKMNKDGKLNFSNAVQRSLTWDNDRKSLLIHSMIIDFPIPPMFCNCIIEDINKRVYDFVDGKQRVLGTIIPFFNDELNLSNIPEIELEDGTIININGLSYSQLPQDIRDKVRTYGLMVYYYENMKQEDIETLFIRLNNGKPVSREHLAFVSASRNVQEFVQRQIAENPLFVTVAHFPESSVKKSDREMSILQSIILSTGLPYDSFSAKDVETFFTQNTNIEDELLNRLESTFVEIAETFTLEHNKFANKVNIPAMVGAFNACGGSAECTERVQKTISEYVKVSKKGDKYRRYTGSGCQKKENVQGRVKTLIELCGNS